MSGVWDQRKSNKSERLTCVGSGEQREQGAGGREQGAEEAAREELIDHAQFPIPNAQCLSSY